MAFITSVANDTNKEDSRTATFELKRTHDVAIRDDVSNGGSTTSTPRKRAKHASKVGYQDVRDFVPSGTSFSTINAPIEEGQIDEHGSHFAESDVEAEDVPLMEGTNSQKGVSTIGKEHEGSVRPAEQPAPAANTEADNSSEGAGEEKSDGLKSEEIRQAIPDQPYIGADFTPAVNWNAGNSIRIRTSLGGGARKSQSTGKDALSNDQETPTVHPIDAGHTDDAKEVRMNADDQSEQSKATQVALTRLEGFRERLTGMDPHDGPVSAYQSARVELENAEVEYNYCLYFPINESFGSPPPMSARRGVMAITAKHERRVRIWNLIKKCMKEGTLQDLRDGKLTAHGAGMNIKLLSERHKSELEAKNKSALASRPQSAASTANATKDQKSAGASSSEDLFASLPLDPEHSTVGSRGDSESDGGIILNTHNGKDSASPGEINDLPTTDQTNGKNERMMVEISSSDDSINDESQDEDDDSPVTNAEDESNEGDEMMEYSKSEQADRAKGDCKEPSNRSKPTNARILADLNSTDFAAQIRYFYITKKPGEVDPNMPVRCLVCGQHGHMADACGALTCDVCGSFNQHATQSCPQVARCSKCREQGHERSGCPYKLKNVDINEVVCDLCERDGHIEGDCELMWRTSGRPWEFNLSNSNVRLSCYECSRSGHLGNDCPGRRPGKSLGTSTWGTGRSQISIKSKDEITIKGSARQHPIDIDDDEMDVGHFIRSKLPQPIGKGIQIKTGANQRQPHGWSPINSVYEGDRIQAPKNNANYNGSGPSQQGRRGDTYYNNYRPSDRRSVSPEYRDRDGYARPDRYQPPPPQLTYRDRRPPQSNNTYRPMPSSAQNAWKRHRL